MSNSLITHCGARQVDRSQLEGIYTPESTATWYPVPHHNVVTMIHEALAASQFTVQREQYAVARENDARLFGTLDLASPLAPGVSLSIGVRNSVDKSLPLGFCAGNRVFVCDNLAFRSDLIVTRKHTRFGLERYREAIALAVRNLAQFQQVETARIQVLKESSVSDDKASAIILKSFEDGITSTRHLGDVIHEWREPRYQDFQPRTLWSLLQAFTTVLGPAYERNPQKYAGMTMSLQALVGGAAGFEVSPQENSMAA